MLTRMTDEDWDLAVDIFRKVRSTRGAKGKDDRRFLEALLYFTLHNITWRALPAEFGKWNSVWRRFSRLLEAGTFEAFFQTLAACSRSAGLLQMFDSTSIRAHVSLPAQKGGGNQALGRCRGGFGTNIRVKCDLDGHPLDFHLTASQASDTKQFEILLGSDPDVTPRGMIADKGYDAASNRAVARRRGAVPIIPYRKNTMGRTRFFPKKAVQTACQGRAVHRQAEAV